MQVRTLRTDVFVAGAGPAGFVAAISAARNGAKVTLAESFGFPGGMATAGLVGPISKFNFGGRRVVGGIPWEFVERLAAAGGAIADLQKGNVPFEAEAYRRVAREMLEEAGVTCLWQTQVCGEPELAADGSIKAVTLSTAGFLTRMEAKRFIDCTASGAIVGHHGLGGFRSEKGNAQPLSLCFILGGVDTDKARVLVRNDNERSANQTLRAALDEAMKEGRIKSFGGPWAVWGSTIRPGFVSVNATRAEATDVTDPIKISEATEQMRREIPTIIDVMRKADPAFRNAWLAQTAATSGFRECRELSALHRVTAAEFASGEDVVDAIALAAHPMDRHLSGSSGQNLAFLERPGVIPLSSLVSAKCPNLLAAGGLVSAEPAPFASMRVQAQCMAMGQAAGTAAAFMLGEDVRRLDFAAVRRVCESQGAITRWSDGKDCVVPCAAQASLRRSFNERLAAKTDAPFLVAHRGCQSLAPENTVASFVCAARLGLDAIETDVRFSADGALVCVHDDTLMRMFGIDRKVADMPLAELRKLTPTKGKGLKSWPKEALRIPTFAEYLDVCEKYDKVPFIETKGDVAVVKPVLDEVRRRGLSKVAVLSSIPFDHVKEARRLDKDIFVHHIFSEPDLLDELAAMGNAGLSYKYKDLAAVPDGLVGRVHAKGVKMCLRAGDTPEEVAKMRGMNLDYIPTNVTIPLN